FGNPNGSWEKDQITNIGFDATVLHNMFDLTFDWYRKSVSGLLYNAPVAATAGNAVPAFFNTGDIVNKGIDVALTYHGNALGRQLHWDVTGTVTAYTNKVISLANGVKYQDRVSQGSSRLPPFTRLQPGEPVGEFFGYKVEGLFASADDVNKSPTQEGKAPGFFKYADINHDGQITDSDRT